MNRAKELIEEFYPDEEIVVFENPSYDTAFVGISQDMRAVYDYDLMVEYLMNEEDMTEIDAADFIDCNTLRACPYIENHPIIVTRLEF